MRHFVPALLATFLAATPLAAQSPSETLKSVMDDHWRWYLSTHPTEATARGVRDYDDRIYDISLVARDAQVKAEKEFLRRLDAIPENDLSAQDRTSRAVLAWMLREDIEDDRHGERVMLFTTYYGWHQGFSSMADGLPFYTAADYRSYLKRLTLYPRQNGDAMAITRQAIAGGYMLPCSVLGNFANGISGIVAGRPEDTRFYEPFKRAKPRDVTDAQWAAMKAEAIATIRDVLTPEYAKFHDLFVKEYQPRCRRSDSASTLPGGAAWYASRVRAHSTTDLTPDAIHQIGLKEVARIAARMDAVAAQAGYSSRKAFIEKLRSDPSYYARTPKELMAAAALQAKTIDGLMPRYFGRLPRLPYGVREIPAAEAPGTTTAYYAPGAPESGIAGTYYVNTSKLDQRPLFELPALTAHEAVPGHHNQIALAQEMDLPPARKYLAGFTAFVEGWALYTEYLGEEMGLYDTPEKMMGRLSYEMWRACRLVVDTGIHAKGWDKARAVAFMRDNSALTDANIDAEVNRYISWPGQALGYKLGEIRIRELREKAQSALGERFDLKRFHDAVLAQGAVPLDLLTAQIDAWIAAEKARG
ncbi:MAG: DUF885 domain-containing protein [Sphingobium sp.]|nr:DUF885 domain-containing protein [Sphingobium sp.]